MPQTMPLNWLSLYFFFIMVFIFIIIKIYYLQNKMPTFIKSSFEKKNNWKW